MSEDTCKDCRLFANDEIYRCYYPADSDGDIFPSVASLVKEGKIFIDFCLITLEKRGKDQIACDEFSLKHDDPS